MVGLRVGPRTKRATGYCAKNDWDCQRDNAYQLSEAMLEKTRREMFLDRISRQNAVFFYPREGNYWWDEPGAMVTSEDEYGRPVYDFGFGKDTLFVVDSRKVPCRCGVGNGTRSDEVFGIYQERIKRQVDPNWRLADALGSEAAELFWKQVKEYDPAKFDVWKEQDEGDEDYQPEVWCPCAIPRDAIEEKYDKNNPLPDIRYGGFA